MKQEVSTKVIVIVIIAVLVVGFLVYKFTIGKPSTDNETTPDSVPGVGEYGRNMQSGGGSGGGAAPARTPGGG